MNEEFFYNNKGASFAVRESFNNAVVLMTMIKSEYYYITGFSRPNLMIEAAFDFESDLHASITEYITLFFDRTSGRLNIECKIDHLLCGTRKEKKRFKTDNGVFTYRNNQYEYKCSISKEDFIPMSIERINSAIIRAKNEIINFIESNYVSLLT